MEYLRTPPHCFDNLARYPFLPRYVVVDPASGMRMHFVCEGKPDAPVVLMLHGEPTWSFLYRRLITMVAEAGYRVIAPDLIGFGRSDKPTRIEDYTYAAHLGWLTTFIDVLRLDQIALVCHDWGGLLGLRLLAAEPQRFARLIASNTFLPTGQHPMPPAFHRWREMSQTLPELDVGLIIQGASATRLPETVLDAYRAPFPDETYKKGVRSFPILVPIEESDPEAVANREAWQTLGAFDKPTLLAFSDSDPITSGIDRIMRGLIEGAKNIEPVVIRGAGHFLQEDRGTDLALELLRFLSEYPMAKPKNRQLTIAPTLDYPDDLDYFDGDEYDEEEYDEEEYDEEEYDEEELDDGIDGADGAPSNVESDAEAASSDDGTAAEITVLTDVDDQAPS